MVLGLDGPFLKSLTSTYINHPASQYMALVLQPQGVTFWILSCQHLTQPLYQNHVLKKKLVKNLCKFVTVLVQKDTTYSLITLINPLITCCEVI